jgi:predicted dienelactone hydrolase
VTAARGNGFGGGVIYYPTATNEGTFGALAISPGLNGTWPGIAWLGPRLASQGFVVFGHRNHQSQRQPHQPRHQLLAALDYLTRSSSVRSRVDANRLAVAGHSMGGCAAPRSRQRSATLPICRREAWQATGYRP